MNTLSPTSPRTAIDVGLVTANLERSLHFYRDLLGLTVVQELTTALIGQGRMVQLSHGQSLLKLVEFKTTPTHPISTDIAVACGYRYITLLTNNIYEILTKLEREAAMIRLKATRLPNGSIIAMVKDPDGNIVEFSQEPLGA
ncbi:VOC family protein [Leptothoe kymatousa]|uniref:VOC family protein n=1 Tax=Leptothoe kymatousa TAU-MAC 1615 TaxID=2364775 RepID=A0ABS5Y5Y9_9CYAN|nr:VOC family protein [Leptothoe kymatousa]MBT9312764.1 VOC family protein [Leptothoe kymatousa TAU-MAC 1615]